jgi:hypothetical protein
MAQTVHQAPHQRDGQLVETVPRDVPRVYCERVSALIVPYWTAALMLIVAGIPKVVDPTPTALVAQGTGLPSSAVVVRALGLVELVVGAGAIFLGGPWFAALVGACYLGFAVVVLRGLIRGDMDSCGCFASDDSPPSPLHVGIDLALALVAAVVTTSGHVPSIFDVFRVTGTGVATITTVLVVVDGALLYLVMTKRPQLGGPDATRPEEDGTVGSVARERVPA